MASFPSSKEVTDHSVTAARFLKRTFLFAGTYYLITGADFPFAFAHYPFSQANLLFAEAYYLIDGADYPFTLAHYPFAEANYLLFFAFYICVEAK